MSSPTHSDHVVAAWDLIVGHGRIMRQAFFDTRRKVCYAAFLKEQGRSPCSDLGTAAFLPSAAYKLAGDPQCPFNREGVIWFKSCSPNCNAELH
jgi:hypothetical protein